MFGEITGSKPNEDDVVGRGLPLRSQYNIRKSTYDDNPKLDFKLYSDNSKSTRNYDIKNNDSNDMYADVHTSMVRLSTQINPISINAVAIDTLNNSMFNYFYETNSLKGMNCLINGFGIYQLFVALYLTSFGATEIELKKIFGFPKKECVQRGLGKILSSLDRLENTETKKMINVKKYIIVGNDVPIDNTLPPMLKRFCKFIVSSGDSVDDANRINELIAKDNLCDGKTNKTKYIIQDNLKNLQLMMLTTATIKPVWHKDFDCIVEEYFGRYRRQFLYSIDSKHGYYEDNKNQILEIKCEGNKMVVGFVMDKTNQTLKIDNDRLNFLISQLKQTNITELMILAQNENIKLRFNSCMKNMGLQTVFTQTQSNLFPENVVLHDILQNINIIIDNGSNGLINKPSKSRPTRTNNGKRFITNKPFLYYFRLIESNTIIFMGFHSI